MTVRNSNKTIFTSVIFPMKTIYQKFCPSKEKRISVETIGMKMAIVIINDVIGA